MSWNPNEKPLSKRELQEIVNAERARQEYESGMNQAGSAAGDLIGAGLVGIHSNPKFVKYNYLMGGISALVSFVLLVYGRTFHRRKQVRLPRCAFLPLLFVT